MNVSLFVETVNNSLTSNAMMEITLSLTGAISANLIALRHAGSALKDTA